MTDFLKFVVIAGLLILSLPQARAETTFVAEIGGEKSKGELT